MTMTPKIQLPSNNLSHPKYRPDIDGLRAIAVLAVVIFHAFPSLLQGGFIGVDIFFVISGYLISTIIYENLNNSTFSFLDFYSRRIRRIFPALLFVVIVTFGFGFFLLFSDEFSQLSRLVTGGIGFVANLILWSEAGYFDAATETKPLLHLWSLGIEEQFYIIWPFLLCVAWKRNFNLLFLIVTILSASFIFNIIDIRSDPVATFYSPLTRIWELLFGSLLAWLMVFNKESFESFKFKINSILPSIIKNKNIFSNLLSVSGISLFLIGFFLITKESYFPGFWALIPVLGTVMIIMAGSEAWINQKILSSKIFIWFGLISFPLYLWHWPILSYGRIYFNTIPPAEFRLIAILVSILFAWLTVKYIEKPIRYSKQKTKTKVIFLCGLAFAIGILGYFSYKENSSEENFMKEPYIVRVGFEHAHGPSLNWYPGNNQWLFLGNNYDKTVEKLKLVNLPDKNNVEMISKNFATITDQSNTKIVFILGPNKSSIYPEFLPKNLVPSKIKYSSYFLNELHKIPNLTVYDPTSNLLKAKEKEGLLYWKTDTHWNEKGAFVAFSGLAKELSLPIPQVDFKQSSTSHIGDLIYISKLKNFPLTPLDSWEVVWKNKPISQEKEIPNEHESPFGKPKNVTTQNSLTDKYVWVIGDSFSEGLKPYINATFKEVHYLGHWNEKLNLLSQELAKASKKPDIIIIERVERSF